jgi:glycosyltransferase EpsE
MSTLAVCVAAYKRADLLPETLDGLVNQTFKDFTVYVSYDSTADNTESVLDRFRDRLSVVGIDDSRSGLGCGPAKNLAVERALADNPDFIQMVDSDDVPAPEMLEVSVDRLLQGDVDWVLCWGRTFGMDNGYIHAEMPTLEQMIDHNHLHAWAMFRSDILRRFNFSFDPQIMSFDDYDLWLKIFKAGYKGAIIKRELYWARMHLGRVTQEMILSGSENCNKVHKHVLAINGLG